MIGELIHILMGFNAADAEAQRQMLAANQRYAEAQNRAEQARAEARNHSFDNGEIIEGTFTVVEEPKLLEAK